ncbi:MAG: PIN domain-containing protein [Fibrobacteres bacterium]|nr:PIN domain-containing protein [Fibrobacterota bacterium]
MTTFIDTNIILSILNEMEHLHDWAVDQLQIRRTLGPTIICDIVYCETSIGMASLDDLNEALTTLGITRIPETDYSLFLAGRAFVNYKHINKGPKNGVLPDFIIGALAYSLEVPLLTADVRRYKTYFPNLELITPPMS